MDKRIAAAFYILLGVVGISVAWAVDGSQGQPAPTTGEVKSQTIELKPEDFNESANLKNAIDRLSQPVQKPTTNGMLDQLQPATREQSSGNLPQ